MEAIKKEKSVTLSRMGISITIPSHLAQSVKDTIAYAFHVYAFVIPYPASLDETNVSLRAFAQAIEENFGKDSPRMNEILCALTSV